MKRLASFLIFLIADFLKGKELTVVGYRDWIDRDTNKKLGTKVEIVITKDMTEYNVGNGDPVTNLYEKFIVKVPKEVSIPLGSHVVLKGAKGRVWGDYNSNLSVTADDIIVVGGDNDEK